MDRPRIGGSSPTRVHVVLIDGRGAEPDRPEILCVLDRERVFGPAFHN